MLIVALGFVAGAVFLFGAGFAVGSAATNVARDEDVMQAVRYERERLANEWQKVRAQAQTVLQAWRAVRQSARYSTPTMSTTTTTHSRTGT